MSANQSLRLAIVDDDDGARSGVARLLRCLGHEVRLFESAEAIEAADVAGLALDCLIVDVRLPGVSGPELRDRLRRRGMLTPVVFITGDAGVRIRDAAHADGRQAFRRGNVAGGDRRRDLVGPRFGRPSCTLTIATGARRRPAASASGTGISSRARSTSIPSSQQMLGYQDREIRNHLDVWGGLVHPDDSAAVFGAGAGARRGRDAALRARASDAPSRRQRPMVPRARLGDERRAGYRRPAWPGPTPTSPRASAAKRRCARRRRSTGGSPRAPATA